MVVENLDELQLYINLLESQNKAKYKNYDAIVSDLSYEFGINITKEQLNKLYSQTIEEHIEDLKMVYDRL
jgi:uncharacterized protein YpmS